MIGEKDEEEAVAVEGGTPEFRESTGLLGLIHHPVALGDGVDNPWQAPAFVSRRDRVRSQPAGGPLDEAPVAVGGDRLHGVAEFLDAGLDRVAPVGSSELVEVGGQSL